MYYSILSLLSATAIVFAAPARRAALPISNVYASAIDDGWGLPLAVGADNAVVINPQGTLLNFGVDGSISTSVAGTRLYLTPGQTAASYYTLEWSTVVASGWTLDSEQNIQGLGSNSFLGCQDPHGVIWLYLQSTTGTDIPGGLYICEVTQMQLTTANWAAGPNWNPNGDQQPNSDGMSVEYSPRT